MPRHSNSQQPTIAVVGPGSLGTALAMTLREAGYDVSAIVIRKDSRNAKRAQALARKIGAKLMRLGKEPLASDVVWLSVPDDSIAAVARVLASLGDWKGRMVFHSSGALTSDELAPLRAKGARVASVHPMMTFIRGEVPQVAGVAFALEGDAAAVRIARAIVEDLGGTPFVIRKKNKVLYHVFGSFASPLVIALIATMEDVAVTAGIRKQDIKPVVVPLLWQTLRNYLKRDAGSAFSGPLARGDVATIKKHLKALQTLPKAREVYAALAKGAIKNLPVKNQVSLARELKR